MDPRVAALLFRVSIFKILCLVNFCAGILEHGNSELLTLVPCVKWAMISAAAHLHS